ncbi:MAG: thiamine-phosphate kinase [Acidobacteriota bacterium]
MDENNFVEFLRSEFPFSHGIGIGDDTSIVKTDKGFQLITKDILIEGIHFDQSYFSPEDIAVKALGVNLSDIAAMGGRPDYFHLGLGFPQSFKGDKLDRFFRSLKKESEKWGIELAGGDLSLSPEMLFISVTMSGFSPDPVRRSGAENGDLIGISRVTGCSATGLELLKMGVDIPYYSKCHKDPGPEVRKGIKFSQYVNSMIDISDGLLIDLGRVMTASGKGAVIRYEDIPVSENMRSVCTKYGLNEVELVLSGGEDFALLFTISPENEKKMRDKVAGYHIIGKVTDEKGVRAESAGEVISFESTGFDHFKHKS